MVDQPPKTLYERASLVRSLASRVVAKLEALREFRVASDRIGDKHAHHRWLSRLEQAAGGEWPAAAQRSEPSPVRRALWRIALRQYRHAGSLTLSMARSTASGVAGALSCGSAPRGPQAAQASRMA